MSDTIEALKCAICGEANDIDAGTCAECGVMLIDGPNQESAAAEPDADVGTVNDDASRNAPRNGLVRSVAFDIREADGDGLSFEGYAAVFNSPAMIDSWEGTFRETIQRGAFKKSIQEMTPVMMFDHGQHPMIGSLPIGQITSLREDSHGLRVEARLLEDPLFGPVREAISKKAISGMSFRMNVTKDAWGLGDDNVPERTIRELACPELGPVVFPAYTSTSASVRSKDILAALTEPEIRAEVLAIIQGTPSPLVGERAADPSAEQGNHSSRSAYLRRKARALLETL